MVRNLHVGHLNIYYTHQLVKSKHRVIPKISYHEQYGLVFHVELYWRRFSPTFILWFPEPIRLNPCSSSILKANHPRILKVKIPCFFLSYACSATSTRTGLVYFNSNIALIGIKQTGLAKDLSSPTSMQYVIKIRLPRYYFIGLTGSQYLGDFVNNLVNWFKWKHLLQTKIKPINWNDHFKSI